MRDVRAFNWRAGVIIVFFLIFIAFAFRDLFTVYENFQEKITVNDRLTLYITQVEAGSLSRNRYHIYLFDAKKARKSSCLTLRILTPSWLPMMIKLR